MSGVRIEATRGATGPGVGDARGVRADIQALRALAVGLVVVYHFFPGAVTGGFVGVDVFFVISGFLITNHLIARPPRNVRDLGEFWGRRVRRLLPASFLVLAVTLVATVLIAPQTMWSAAAKQIAASALYVQNWFLAAESVDYLAEDNAASPVQHFWSLSIEEQFYFVWPILVLVAVMLAARRGRPGPRAAVGVAIALIVVASFAVSVHLTATDPAAAYFVTWTRAWELGVGGLAACVFPWVQARLQGKDALRTVLAYAGLAGILVAGLTYTSALPFPGAIAALPVVATAVVLVAAVRSGALSPLPVLAWRPVQLAGDLSYSIYLWHWPAVILLPHLFGRSLRLWEKLLIIAVVVVLSWLTKLHVEDRFRGRLPLGTPLRRSFAFAAVGMLVIGAGAGAVVATVASAEQSESAQVQELLEDPSSCFGARAMVDETCDPHGDDLVTSAVFAAADRPDPYEDGCWILGDFSDQKTCHYGSTDADAVRVALVGNSHAGHWLPALQQIATQRDWSITTYLISECYTVDVPISFETPARTANCADWNERVMDEIATGEYDLVVTSNRTSRPLEGMSFEETLAQGHEAYGRVLDGWSSAGTPVLVLRDTPYAVELDSVPDCVAAATDLAACDGTRDREQPDPMAVAAAERADDPRIALLDLTDRICAGDVCQSVVGGVIVYFDRGHLSGTFARSLAPDVAAAADALLAGASR